MCTVAANRTLPNSTALATPSAAANAGAHSVPPRINPSDAPIPTGKTYPAGGQATGRNMLALWHRQTIIFGWLASH
jgi:hypothetical protein